MSKTPITKGRKAKFSDIELGKKPEKVDYIYQVLELNTGDKKFISFDKYEFTDFEGLQPKY